MFKTYNQVELFFEGRKKLGIKPGLARINLLLNMLDNPQNKMKAIHVAGTNGKGSTIGYMKNALIANGYQVGLFTSPSLEGLTGHIFKNSKAISENEIVSIVNKIYPCIEQMDKDDMALTEFEIITVLAFVYFAEYVDIALIESGMGGREDTTNCFTPILSIITNVDKDHTAFLGDTLEEIAYHKAGIIKHNIPVIIGEMKEESVKVINKEALSKSAKVYKITNDFTFSDIETSADGQKFLWHGSDIHNLHVVLRMYGKHQARNASLAIKALEVLIGSGFKHDWKKSLAAIEQTQIPGRFEVVQTKPTIILDGAHNPAGMDAFLQTVSNNYKDKKKKLIFAGFKDKDLDLMLRKCIPYFDTITLTTFEHPRAASSDELSAIIQSANMELTANWLDAVNKITHSAERDSHYFFTGSLHFISIIRSFYINRAMKEK